MSIYFSETVLGIWRAFTPTARSRSSMGPGAAGGAKGIQVEEAADGVAHLSCVSGLNAEHLDGMEPLSSPPMAIAVCHVCAIEGNAQFEHCWDSQHKIVG
jgi:hypothetical protein